MNKPGYRGILAEKLHIIGEGMIPEAPGEPDEVQQSIAFIGRE